MADKYPWQSQPSAKSGFVDEFSAFLTVKPGQAENLRKAAVAYTKLPERSAASPQAEEAMRIVGIHHFRITVFDKGTRMLFATSFDTDFEPYIRDSMRIIGLHKWGQFLQYTEEAPKGIEIPGKVSIDEGAEWLNANRIRAATYEDSFYDMTIGMKQKAVRVYKAFQQVLENPGAEQALQHPALKPLLAEAAD